MITVTCHIVGCSVHVENADGQVTGEHYLESGMVVVPMIRCCCLKLLSIFFQGIRYTRYIATVFGAAHVVVKT